MVQGRCVPGKWYKIPVPGPDFLCNGRGPTLLDQELAYSEKVMAEEAPKYDPERQASLAGVPEGLASADDAAVLGIAL